MICLPNFLIIGAAKSGTTSLANYLGRHPDIYMSPIKEPKYITYQFLRNHYCGEGDELVKQSIVKQFNDYTALFSDVRGEVCIGEASADLLYYGDRSIPIIKELLGDEIKIIIILRNPVERAYSAYMHMLRDQREHLSFEEALRAEEERREKGWEFIWHYKNAGNYYRQVSRYIKSFPNIKVLFFDDLITDMKSLLLDVYDFLKVDKTFLPDNLGKTYNASGVPRVEFIQSFLLKENVLKSLLRPLIPLRIRQQTRRWLFDLNLEKRPLLKEDKKFLLDYYQADVLKLSSLLNKDLSYWLLEFQDG